MNKYILFFLCLLSFGNINAQPFWYQTLGGSANDEGTDIVADVNKNVYTCGFFTNSIIFDSTTINGFGATDIFISKHDSTGKLVWIIKAGGPSVDRATGITLDQFGNIYLTGTFSGNALFDTQHVISTGSEDIFIAKYYPNGHIDWVKAGGSVSNDMPSGITIDPNRNITISGYFNSVFTFGNLSVTSYNDPVTTIPSTDVFTLQVDSTGTVRWLKKGGSIYTDKGLGITSDPTGAVYVAGLFSDTATFDNVHPNNMFNAIFIIKYDNNGNEVWWRTVGGSTYNTVSSITIDKNSQLIFCGNFTGILTFFGSQNQLLQSHYQNNIYVAKYDSAGNYIWSATNGSFSPTQATAIAADDSNNVYVGGTFNCTHTEFSNFYGSGTFNSVGFEDMFYSKFNSNGQWQKAYQYGSQEQDACNGISIFNSYYPILTGKYGYSLCGLNDHNFYKPLKSYWYSPMRIYHLCGDTSTFSLTMYSRGGSDIAILNGADPSLPPYYFFIGLDSISFCNHLTTGTCISLFSNCLDTLYHCDGGFDFRANTHRWGLSSIGSGSPKFHYLWSTGDISYHVLYHAFFGGTQTIWVTVQSYDGCYSESDTVVLIANQQLPEPLLSDDKGINNSAGSASTLPVHICKGDSIHFSITNVANYNAMLYVPGIDTGISTLSFYSDTLDIGLYTLMATFIDSCSSYNRIDIYVDSALKNIKPGILLHSNNNDSVELCLGGSFDLYLFDSITDPLANQGCNDYIHFYSTCNWISNPPLNSIRICTNPINIARQFYPTTTGYYTFNCTLIRNSPCGGVDTFNLQKTIYATVNPPPNPNINTIGDSILCPGDSVLLAISGADLYSWTTIDGLIHGNLHNDSIYGMLSGLYDVAYIDSNQYGCRTTGSYHWQINSPQLPQIYTNPASGLICPGDSVLLYSNSQNNITWYDPYGNSFQSLTHYSSIPGLYYCSSDSSGCVLFSNLLEIREYATPFLSVFPNNVICPNGSALIQVITTNNSVISWGSPLIGSDTFQVVTSPGVYQCSVTSCNITTNVQATIVGSAVTASLTPTGPIQLCNFDTIHLQANPGMVQYQWNNYYNNTPFADITQAGSYFVITSDPYGCSDTSNTVTINYLINAQVNSTEEFCEGDTLRLFITPEQNTTYDWSGPNTYHSPTNELIIYPAQPTDSGLYILNRMNGNCNIVDSVLVTSLKTYFVINADATPCMDESVVLYPTPEYSNYQYEWTTPEGINSNASHFQISHVNETDTGTYILSIVNNGCQSASYYHLTVSECDSLIANVITPNGDGLNDFFILNEKTPMTFKLYNRWGRLIFECNNCTTIKWDGDINSKEVSDGAYYYILTSSEYIKRGYIQVIR